MIRSPVPCLCCGLCGAPGLTAVLSVEAGSTPGLELVRTAIPVLDVQWYSLTCDYKNV